MVILAHHKRAVRSLSPTAQGPYGFSPTVKGPTPYTHEYSTSTLYTISP